MATLDLYSYSLPLSTPFEPANGPLERRDGLLLRLITDEGTEGWGDVAPLPGFSRETLDEAREQCRQLSGISDAGRPLDYDRLLPSVRFGFESALLEAQARKNETPLHRQLNPAARSAVETNALLSGSPDDILREARSLEGAGYAAAKLKVGRRTPDEDIELTREVRELISDDTSLLLDANRAWTLDEAVHVAGNIADLDVMYVEEPLRNRDELKTLSAHMSIALDETLTELSSEKELKALSFVKGVVLKPTLLGGITAARTLGLEAMKHDIKVSVSSSFESGVGARLLLALAASLPYSIAGLKPYSRLARDVLEPRLELDSPVLDADALLARRPSLQYDQLEHLTS